MDDPTKLFEKDVGTWDAEIEVRMQPGAEPQRSTGESVQRLVGGRWLVADFKNHTTGFEGHGIYGWDMPKKSYVGTWVDSERKSLVISLGSWDEVSHTMTYISEVMVQGQAYRWRELVQTVDANTQTFRALMPLPDGAEFEMMTVVYKRRLA